MNRPYRPRTGVDPVLRGRARRRALQAIYAWQISGGTTQQVIAQFAHEQAHEVADLEYFEDLVRGVLAERAVLRLAAYELLHRPDVPYRVVLNEAIEIAKRFGSEHGHTYVNGVLDKAALALRGTESQAARPR